MMSKKSKMSKMIFGIIRRILEVKENEHHLTQHLHFKKWQIKARKEILSISVAEAK